MEPRRRQAGVEAANQERLHEREKETPARKSKSIVKTATAHRDEVAAHLPTEWEQQFARTRHPRYVQLGKSRRTPVAAVRAYATTNLKNLR
jgi:hypothetical protein